MLDMYGARVLLVRSVLAVFRPMVQGAVVKVRYEWRQRPDDRWIHLGDYPRDVIVWWPYLYGGEYMVTLLWEDRTK